MKTIKVAMHYERCVEVEVSDKEYETMKNATEGADDILDEVYDKAQDDKSVPEVWLGTTILGDNDEELGCCY